MGDHRDIALISVSIDLGAGRRGVDMGPSALRIAGISREIEAIGHTVRELGVRVFSMSEIDERGVGPCMDEALERASAGTAGFHLSFDLDALDPRIAPGVGMSVRGGLTYREGHLVCEKASRSGTLPSLELVELNPVLDDRNQTAELGVGLVASALGATIL